MKSRPMTEAEIRQAHHQWQKQFGGYKMRVYVAGSYQFRPDISRLVDLIQQAIPDFEPTSTWITQGEEATELNKKGYQHFIDLDVEDIRRADVFLLLNEPSVSKDSTGKWVELGIAMALNKMIVVWGAAQDSLFIHGDTVVQIHSVVVDDLIANLQIVNKVRKELYANRNVNRAAELRSGGPTAPDSSEGGGEISSPGILHREGGSLHDLDRALENRVKGAETGAGRAGERFTPVGTPISQLKP